MLQVYIIFIFNDTLAEKQYHTFIPLAPITLITFTKMIFLRSFLSVTHLNTTLTLCLTDDGCDIMFDKKCANGKCIPKRKKCGKMLYTLVLFSLNKHVNVIEKKVFITELSQLISFTLLPPTTVSLSRPLKS